VNQLQEISRLNLALELVSECAGLADAEAVARLVSERLRWLFDFDACFLALQVGGELRRLAMRPGDEGLSPASGEHHGAPQWALVQSAMSTGAPAAAGQPMLSIAHPLGSPERPQGALCIQGRAGYSHRDLRYLHHVCAGLGAALLRIEQSGQLSGARELAAHQDRDARDEAWAANDSKDRFLAMLGHELRKPLAPILTAAELLRREASGHTLARVEIIQRQARHLDRLVGDLLDVSRVTTGKVNLRLLAVDLREVVSKAAEMVRPRIEAKGQALSVDVPEEAVMVHGDEARLAQVISNLLTNASAYSPAGAQVELRIAATDGGVVLEVRDNGIGIASSMLDSIFDMFVQGGRSQEWAPGGLGLGLGVSRALVEMHGGSISAASEGEGQGSTFRVTLPLLPPGMAQVETAPAADHAATPANDAGSPARILVVDDNADAADSLGALLQEFGHEVVVAYGPIEALAAVEGFAPQIALLDIGLQVMDGYELAQELRKRLGLNAPAMIALSGYGQESDRKRSAEAAFSAHLVKPVDLDALFESIERAQSAN